MTQEDMSTVLDGIEAVLVITVQNFVKQFTKQEITVEGAKNIISKVGVRLMYGKDMTDPILTKISERDI
jgi:hypothetical protein